MSSFIDKFYVCEIDITHQSSPSEFYSWEFIKNSDIAKFKKAFRIYKQSDRSNDSQTVETFVLEFVSDELMYSDQQKINQSYDLTYTQIVEKILLDYLKISKNNTGGVFDVSYGIRNITIPNLRPFDAIDWCAKRAVDSKERYPLPELANP